MKLPYEKGVSSKSELYNVTPSKQAESVLFYLQRLGHFYCSTEYLVERNNNENFLIAVVLQGKLKICCNHVTAVATAGDAAFINCYYPHCYQAIEPVEYIWIHFDGANTARFFEELMQENGTFIVNTTQERIQNRIKQLLDQFRKVGKIEDVTASRRLHDLLCDFLFSSTLQEVEQPIIAKAKQYIDTHFTENITVADIARYCAVSTSYFTRLFRQNMGQSPHEYWTNLRINNAKNLLKETEMSVTEIALQVGFSYDTSFISAFRKKTGLSPNKFRKNPI